MMNFYKMIRLEDLDRISLFGEHQDYLNYPIEKFLNKSIEKNGGEAFIIKKRKGVEMY